MDLEGTLESLTFFNEDTGYAVVRLRVRGEAHPITAVGTLTAPAAGQTLELKGEWQLHPRFGRQFRIQESRVRMPVSLDGIERYLGSGLIKGIGPELARRITERFGADTLRVLEQEPRRLAEVDGIGAKRLSLLREAWEAQRGIREVMLFLQSHGVGPGHAHRIFRQYGTHSIRRITENPYRLAEEVYGIGFLSADRIAGKLGFSREAPERAQAGILFALREGSEQGHVFLPKALLMRQVQKLLGLEAPLIERGLETLQAGGQVVVEGGDALYLPSLHAAEAGTALRLQELRGTPRPPLLPLQETPATVAAAQRLLGITLSARQAQALEAALREKLLVITGGPGTGKTTILRVLMAVLSRLPLHVQLAAPTGRAAKRISEITGREAKTIHRLLEFDQRTGGFRKGPGDPLACDLAVVDETSMVDTLLLYQLLRALPSTSALLLIGDAHQLASVGPGNVLRDVIASGRIPVVELDEIFRQARASRIVTNAHRVKAGQMPLWDAEDAASDFFVIEQEDPEKVARIILQLVTERIPRRFGLDPFEGIQVLSPMHRGAAGVENLNLLLQQALNPAAAGIERGQRRYSPGDKVLQLRNNYEKDVFNGDIGRIARIDRESHEVEAVFEGRPVRYEASELDELALAYAVSVHKAQGCEFPAVVVPVLTQHYVLLQRNLLYTAITRGKRLVVLVGTAKAIRLAIARERAQERHTRLAERLRAAMPSPQLPFSGYPV